MEVGGRNVRLSLALLLVAAMLGACASAPPPPKPTIIQATIDVRASTNPDARGRPSPVVLRFYELKSLGAFNGGDFFSLFDKDKEVLGPELVAREEFQLTPGANRQFERKLQPETAYIAVVAAFRDLERAQWRASMPVVPQQTTPVVIRLEGSTVNMGGR